MANVKAESTISDIEQIVQDGLEQLRDAPLSERITAALSFLTPPGYKPIAQLEEDGRKKRSTAAASNWSPETGEIRIYFERLGEPKSGVASYGWTNPERAQEMAKPEPPSEEVTDDDIKQCCEALAETERAGRAFIALKWFRDTELMSKSYPWSASLAHRQAVLTKAIDVGALQTTQIPNPKAPQHPTTTIRLNRESKYAQSVPPRFQPIRLRGNGPSASELLVRERGRF